VEGRSNIFKVLSWHLLEGWGDNLPGLACLRVKTETTDHPNMSKIANNYIILFI